jgi:hypothetical protein
MADLKVTDRCPRGHRCESCGQACPGLQVVVIDVLGAVMCLTLCPGCRTSGRAPQIMLSTAQKLVEQHRMHVTGFTTADHRL